MVTLYLPFPPTLNHTNGLGVSKSGKPYVYSKQNLKKFKADAHVMYLQQRKKCGEPIRGYFTYHVVLDQAQRSPVMDGQNRDKYVLDFLQDVGLIENDKLSDGGGWTWGPVNGCLVRVYKVTVA